MKPGDVVKFAIEKGNHICKVQIVNEVKADRPYFICRRVDNGTPVLAWPEDLK